ncbi:MAG TPA: FAD-dependent oxidoreductase [Magnetospirillaceae bacterium]|nr:FAD-dependent oxidoreductase [Magnetospirillaceae bacterium]
MSPRILIAGAGHAGGTLAVLLRHFGHQGPITLIGEEAVLPYQRPPLSKAYLTGQAGVEGLKLRADGFYADNKVTTLLSTRVESIQRETRTVTLNDGATLPFDVLILATGCRARTLPIPGALVLRSLADADRLKHALRPGARLAIIGGGYVGLEVAASARAAGAEATIFEREKRILARVASETLSRFFHEYHTARGVEIRTGAAFEKGDYDAVIVGIGADPCDELAKAAGLACDRGIIVDQAARTSDPAIYAIGDATLRPVPLYDGRLRRLESVPSALEQAKQAASSILGRPAPPPEVPWFWSDQYDLKLQIAGLTGEADQLVTRGDPKTGCFAMFHLREKKLAAVEAVNSPPEFMMGKKMIEQRTPVSPERLADPALSMKEIAG